MTEFDDQQKQWLQGFVSGLEARKAADKLTNRSAAAGCAVEPRRAAVRRPGPRAGGGRQAGRRGDRQAPAPSARSLGRSRRPRQGRAVPQGHRRLPDQVPGPVLRRAGAGLLHVPPAHPRRHLERLAVPRPGRCRRRLRRRLCRRDHPRQPADPRDRRGARRRPADGGAGARPHRARLGRRQHPQHHRQPDRRHRPAGADRHAAAVQRDAPLHPQSPRDVRPAAQVQHRLRRRRARAGARGHQRHRLRRRARSPMAGRARRLLPPAARRHHRPPRLRPRDRHPARSPTSAWPSRPPSSAPSSPTATAPTARRRG